MSDSSLQKFCRSSTALHKLVSCVVLQVATNPGRQHPINRWRAMFILMKRQNEKITYCS